MPEAASVEGVLQILAQAADFSLRKLADAIEHRRIPEDLQMLNSLAESAYPYVSILRTLRKRFELSEEWQDVIDGFWNDLHYMRELVRELMRKAGEGQGG